MVPSMSASRVSIRICGACCICRSSRISRTRSLNCCSLAICASVYHDNHPIKDYEMANRAEVLDPPHAIAWQPGQGPDDANLALRRMDPALRPQAERAG